MPRGRPRGSGGVGGVDKPRGRMSAYAFFVQTCREEHKKQHPEENVQFAQFSRQCADRWKTMSNKEKKRFHDLAATDKDRYNAQMQDYVPPPGSGRKRRARGSKRMKDPNKPKRALSAFFYYANVERPNVRSLNPDFSVGEVAKELGRQWNELSESEKAPHEKNAEEDRARYDRDMALYRAGAPPGPAPVPAAVSNGHSNGSAALAPSLEESDGEPEGDLSDKEMSDAEEDGDEEDDVE